MCAGTDQSRMDRRPTRRRFAVLAGLGLTVLAGCTGPEGDEGAEEDDGDDEGDADGGEEEGGPGYSAPTDRRAGGSLR